MLRPQVAEAVLEIAEKQGRPALPTLTYLANSMAVGDRTLPYSTVAALPWSVADGLGGWQPETTGTASTRPWASTLATVSHPRTGQVSRTIC